MFPTVPHIKEAYDDDVTNASRTKFTNLYSLEYDDTLLSFFELDSSRISLPRIGIWLHGREPSAMVSEARAHGLPATAGYQLCESPVYALEGGIAVSGSELPPFLIRWRCVSVTAFNGIFAPYWIDDAKGSIFGISQHTQHGHIARANLEAVCLQTKTILNAMEKDIGEKLRELTVDGGLSVSDICMHPQSDIIQIYIERPKMYEITAADAAIAAGYAIGIFEDLDGLRGLNRSNSMIFESEITESES
ncbi:hypothetical protein PAAG_11543 [Paracoccidioides lutzii Pb01]|uniref:Carbohydrate kinase FGGY C-terminal domain-containing protein n=1 Tax=Paracoccidioides lutzii (strain ATCC MYA-826 / Pb01) TaxID=502779 RepID=A0A0A2V5V6_PARBA|nr:hypothetical protein PAAG_11543 [Paracoccidioides lutzii Pb01]KGQ01697.1 hypothetical protein PAAG_11543 [Paracoccidioides lutzii Pb01]